MAQLKKPLAAALGAAFLASSIAPLAAAGVNPFGAQQLGGGYDLANYNQHAEGSCGDKAKEGSCGDKAKEGSCGDKATEDSGADKAKEGKCGEGKCGGK